MKLNNFLQTSFYIILALSLISCGSSSSVSKDPTVTGPTPNGSGNGATGTGYNGPAAVNVMKVEVNGTNLCDPNHQYPDEPCVSVTLCVPGTSQCQTINNILLDTGSYGLRVFASAVTIPLTHLTNLSGKTITECALFGSGADWGPVATADVVMGDTSLGGETAPSVPLQLIDSTFSNFANHKSYCNDGSVDTNEAEADFNGILGIGVFAQDCGDDCDPAIGNDANNGNYFACNGSSCTGTTLSNSLQVINPVALLPADNNGVILELPSVAFGGVPSVSGALLLGIGTRSNNVPGSSQVAYQADNLGEFKTTFLNQTLTAIIDSGTNGYSFNDSSLPLCSGSDTFYCPNPEASLNGIQVGSDSKYSASIPFYVGDVDSYAAANWAFSDIAMNLGGSQGLFIWGLPFFFGRNIYVGLNGQPSSLGTGPYWSY